MSRHLNNRDLAYEQIAADWGSFMDNYDLRRRIEVLVHDFLGDRVAGKSVLDAGCGLGDFSQALAVLSPSRHVAVDISPSLVSALQHKMPTVDARVADLLDLPAALGQETFDLVVCSEVIEHTPDPLLAVRNLAAHVRPGGMLALSCPNALWKWSLYCAKTLGVRKKYLGYENWQWGRSLKGELRACGLRVVREEGVHLLPWHVCPKSVLRATDARLRRFTYGISVNLAVLAIRD
jgi:2-polyprenyl-3-methyl-5-hydroxy-6-metoxy-1,4-benzoquinol methylase